MRTDSQYQQAKDERVAQMEAQVHAKKWRAWRACSRKRPVFGSSARKKKVAISYIHTDHQSSVIAITDSAGNPISRRNYGVYGETAASQMSGASGAASLRPFCGFESAPSTFNLLRKPPTKPFGYTGRRYDADTGLYYYRARWYDPELGTFLETDPIGELDYINMYAYVGLDPLGKTDPTGEQDVGNRFRNVPLPRMPDWRAMMRVPVPAPASPVRDVTYQGSISGSFVAGTGGQVVVGRYGYINEFGRVSERGAFVAFAAVAGYDLSFGANLSVTGGRPENSSSLQGSGGVGVGLVSFSVSDSLSREGELGNPTLAVGVGISGPGPSGTAGGGGTLFLPDNARLHAGQALGDGVSVTNIRENGSAVLNVRISNGNDVRIVCDHRNGGYSCHQ